MKILHTVVWETKDGKRFTKECDAINHEIHLRLVEFVDEEFCYENVREQIIQTLFDNRLKVARILTGCVDKENVIQK